MIRILLADDHPVVRAGVRALLETEPDLEIVGEAPTAADAVRLAAEAWPDVVLMDLQFGDGPAGGVEATATITSAGPTPRVIVLTTYGTDADILAALEAGAVGYLLKDAPPEELVAAVRAAAAGASALAPAIATRLVERVRTPGTQLTARETEVLALVAEGLTNQQVSRRLFLSEATVKSHLAHVFTKLGVDSRTAAVTTARDRGILRA
ncbi:response regulator [Sanguibacter massiliensis]|uniref:response regulator n=1 Tax=Sanguibacter massiliensis TaxID=1973217 RepID=UPI000C8320FF|nr:response regulator transcription factor [Sanguibacter massiliensis]